jgi:hypothetical protein
MPSNSPSRKCLAIALSREFVEQGFRIFEIGRTESYS